MPLDLPLRLAVSHGKYGNTHLVEKDADPLTRPILALVPYVDRNPEFAGAFVERLARSYNALRRLVKVEEITPELVDHLFEQHEEYAKRLEFAQGSLLELKKLVGPSLEADWPQAWDKLKAALEVTDTGTVPPEGEPPAQG